MSELEHMMDDKDGQNDIPDKLRFDIRAYVWVSYSIPHSLSQTLCILWPGTNGAGACA